jgi:tetratricopeptide (TPR) repeat protein
VGLSIASIYASAIETHSKLRNVIENSTDSALLSKVGAALTGRGMEEKGLDLLQRAIDLDPGNPRWQDALESAKAEPIRQWNYRHALDRFRARQ